MSRRGKMTTIIIATVVVTALIVLIGLNFAPPEKKIERRITHAAAAETPQFAREMGSLNVYDRRFAEAMTASFEDDLEHARAITLEQWQQRPWLQRARERFASLFKSQL